MQTIQLINETWQPEPSKNLATVPVKEGKTQEAILNSGFSWEDLRGLSWVLYDEVDTI